MTHIKKQHTIWDLPNPVLYTNLLQMLWMGIAFICRIWMQLLGIILFLLFIVWMHYNCFFFQFNSIANSTFKHHYQSYYIWRWLCCYAFVENQAIQSFTYFRWQANPDLLSEKSMHSLSVWVHLAKFPIQKHLIFITDFIGFCTIFMYCYIYCVMEMLILMWWMNVNIVSQIYQYTKLGESWILYTYAHVHLLSIL